VTVHFTRAARRDLIGRRATEAKAVLDAIEMFVETGIGDVKKLRDYDPPTWRLRVGRLRVLFRREASAMIVDRIVDRRDAYR
jgi:mRNA-degrading endonuclease RelE of RelBE toxin-antitoxin system